MTICKILIVLPISCIIIILMQISCMILVVRILVETAIVAIEIDLVIVVHNSLMNACVLYHDLVESASPVPAQISYQIMIMLYMHIMLKMLRDSHIS